jgi:hypothetical protein
MMHYEVLGTNQWWSILTKWIRIFSQNSLRPLLTCSHVQWGTRTLGHLKDVLSQYLTSSKQEIQLPHSSHRTVRIPRSRTYAGKGDLAIPSSYRSWVLDQPEAYQSKYIRMLAFCPCLSVSTLCVVPDTAQFDVTLRCNSPLLACHIHLHNHSIVGGKMVMQPSGNSPI